MIIHRNYDFTTISTKYSTRFFLQPLTVAIMFTVAGLATTANAGEEQESSSKFANFDNSMLWGAGAQTLDINRYNNGNPVEPGTYSVDVSLNGSPAGRYDITFVPGAAADQAKPELSANILEKIGVNIDKLQDSYSNTVPTRDLFSLIPDASYRFNSAEQRLELSIPQIALLNRPLGYVDPARWDQGVNAAFIDYNINTYQNTSQGIRNNTAYANFTAGINLNNWRLRQRSTLNWDKRGRKTYQAISSYAQRDIDALSSQLTLGDSFTDGELFDALATRGVQLATDDRMLPESQRGYAPVVRGVASTNARVTIRQNGFIIQEKTVAPGGFEISDLNPASTSGDLEVTVTEADGQEKHFTVPFSSLSRSLRAGTSRYTATVGQVRELLYGSTPLIAQGTYQLGLTNLITGYTGFSAAEGYGSAILGGVLNSEYGAFGADITTSKTSLEGKTFTGQSARVTYNKILQSTGTNFTVAAYRYSTAGYFGTYDALNARDQLDAIGDSRGGVASIRHARSKAQLNVSQNIGNRSYLYISSSIQNYWNSSGTDKQYQAGFNQNFSWGSAGVSATRTQDILGNDTTQYMVNMSIPLGSPSSRNRPYLSASATTNSDGSANLQSTLSGTSGDDQSLSYGLTTSSNHPGGGRDNTSNLGANAQYRTSVASVSASVSKGNGFQQASMGASGSVVVHPAGITFGQSLGDSIAIVVAPEAAGAKLTNTTGVKLDRSGQAVVPYITPYQINSLELDPKGIPDDVELLSTSQEVVPRSGAVIMAKFNTISGRAFLINAHQANGKPLPFGAGAYDEKGQAVGVVGQGGQIFVRVNGDQGKLRISTNGKDLNQCTLSYQLSPKPKGGAASKLETVDLTCER